MAHQQQGSVIVIIIIWGDPFPWLRNMWMTPNSILIEDHGDGGIEKKHQDDNEGNGEESETLEEGAGSGLVKQPLVTGGQRPPTIIPQRKPWSTKTS